MESTIEIRNVSKSFGGPLVLRNVSVNLSPGKVLGLVGENGSGKSTLIKILSGFHDPEPGGEVIVAGTSMPFGSPTASRAAGLRFVHQNLGHVLAMNAVENMGLGSGYSSRAWINWKNEARRTREALALLHIEMDVEKPLAQARAVERAAVAIARAIKPENDNEIHLLVLDEPTASLPPAEVETLFNIIRRSAERGMAIMYVSHRLDEVEEITDEVAVLRDGTLIGGHKLREIGRSKLISMMIGRELQTVEEALAYIGETNEVDVVKQPVVSTHTLRR
jgi:ribose transport system ATP-binding protein